MTFEVQTVLGRFSRLGVIVGDRILDLNAAYAWHLNEQGDPQAKRVADVLIPANMREFLENGERAMENARLMQEYYKNHAFAENEGLNGEMLVFNLKDVQLKTPLSNPNSLRDFLAFEVHTKSGFERRKEPMPQEWYELPVYYKGNHRTLIGPEEPVLWPQYTEKLDYELELACVIGKKGRNIHESQAANYIAGYMILNDISARDIQGREMKCRLGPAKGKDFCSVFGPYLVTPDEVGDPRNLRMTAKINGETWSDGNSSTSHWTFEQMIAHVSMDETLYPGDIFGSGTVGNGCGLELNRWIQPGDEIELEIEKLGVLRNTIMAPASVKTVSVS